MISICSSRSTQSLLRSRGPWVIPPALANHNILFVGRAYHHPPTNSEKNKTAPLPTSSKFRQQSSLSSAVHGKGNDDDETIPSAKPAYLDGVPEYMEKVYWWAYLHPNAVRIFERQWLANAILFGCYNKLHNSAVSALLNSKDKKTIEGHLLQVACVYGNLTERIAQRVQFDSSSISSSFQVVDVSPVQIENLKSKLGPSSKVSVSHGDGADLCFPHRSFDQILYFFLLHEVPEEVRVNILKEATRVLKEDGRIVFVDYHKPSSFFHPHRYLMPFVFGALEPFAMDLWEHEIEDWIPQEFKEKCSIEKELFFGGLYQRVVVTRKK